MSKYYGIVARNDYGVTVAMEMVNASKVRSRIDELTESSCDVDLFECKLIEFDVVTERAVYVNGERI